MWNIFSAMATFLCLSMVGILMTSKSFVDHDRDNIVFETGSFNARELWEKIIWSSLEDFLLSEVKSRIDIIGGSYIGRPQTCILGIAGFDLVCATYFDA